MAQPKQPKGSGKDDREKQKELTPEEMAKLAEEKPLTGLVPSFVEQDDRREQEETVQSPDEYDDGEYSGEVDEDEYDDPDSEYEDTYAEDVQVGAAVHTGGEDGEGDQSQEEPAAESTTNMNAPEEKKLSPFSHKTIVLGLNEKIERCLETGGEEIGSLGLDAIYKGDITRALSPHHRKPALFKAVVSDPDLMTDARRLSEFIGASALRRDLVQRGESVSNLPPSKLVALLPVRDEDLRRQLAREANERNYSVRQIKNLVKGFTPRKVTEDIGKTIMKRIGGPLQMLNDDDLFTLCSDRDRLRKDLSKAEREKILEQIKEGKPRLKALDELVESLELTLEQIEEED